MESLEEKIGRAATKKYIKDVLSEDKNPQNKDQMLEPDIKSPFLKYGLQHQILRLEDEDDKSSYLVLYITYRLYTNIDVFLYISEYMSRLIKQVFFFVLETLETIVSDSMSVDRVTGLLCRTSPTY